MKDRQLIHRDEPDVIPYTALRPTTPATGERPFYGRVESLRGIGALAVAGYHFTGYTLHGFALFPPIPWDGVGTSQNALRQLGLACLPAHAALMAFFVISGFVLRLSLGHGPQKAPAAAARFFLGRLFRIYPIVIFAMLLTAGLAGWRGSPTGQSVQPLTAPLLLANLLLLDVSLNTTFWALQVELLMVPIILVLYFLERRRGPGVLLVVALVTTALAYDSRWALWRPLSHNVFAFVLGMLVPTLGRRFALGMSRAAAVRWAIAAIVALWLPNPCLGLYARTSAVIEAYAAVVLISLVVYGPDLRGFKCLDGKALRLLGLSSGSYYVLHTATPPLAIALARVMVPPAWSANVPGLIGFIVIPAWLVLIAPLMWCSYHLIEAPGIALGRRVVRACRLDAPSVASPGEQHRAERRAA